MCSVSVIQGQQKGVRSKLTNTTEIMLIISGMTKE